MADEARCQLCGELMPEGEEMFNYHGYSGPCPKGISQKAMYEAKVKANTKVSGTGIFGVTMHMPCPFCAEADFLVYTVVDSEKALGEGAVCQHCGRGMKAVFQHDGGGVQFELVQTVGDDPPEYVPKMRRVQ